MDPRPRARSGQFLRGLCSQSRGETREKRRLKIRPRVVAAHETAGRGFPRRNWRQLLRGLLLAFLLHLTIGFRLSNEVFGGGVMVPILL